METTPIITVEEFDPTILRKEIPLLKRRRGNQGTKTKWYYKDIVCAFDIETTNVPFCDCAVMYLWQFQFGHLYTIMGRTWDEFMKLLNGLKSNLWSEERIYIGVHNLSFEFQFLSGIYHFMKDEVFATKPRRILRAEMFDKRLQFACTYIHSNMSLAEYTRKMQVDHVKLSGEEYNYNRIRFPWTELTDYEIKYGQHDVIGLVEAVEKEMEIEGDNLYSLPMTSTGYVRRDTKKALRKAGVDLRPLMPSWEVYQLLREAFRGGDTHANRYYVNRHLHNIYSDDRSSSYPDVMCNCLFPVTIFGRVPGVTAAKVIKLMASREYALLFRVSFHNLKLRDRYWPDPYLSKDKSRNIQKGKYDNGRILSCAYCETTLTDVDLEIIADTYEWSDIVFSDVYASRYGKLPQPIIDVNIDYYRRKTELKNVENEQVFYVKAKNKLNAVYGMTAEDPVKCALLYNYKTQEWNESEEKTDRELLEDHNKKGFLPYQFGIWVTAWARYRLYEGIKLCHESGECHVYNDTDSVKHIGPVDFTSYNKERIRASKESGAYATDKNGVTHYMGVYEPEHTMSDFATLGAKKYCFIEDGKSDLKITIAGVVKDKGGKELQRRGGIESFLVGDDLEKTFTFYDAGGLEAVYDDRLDPRHITIDGHKLEITRNVQLQPSTYTLGVKGEYQRLLQGLSVL